MIWLEIIKRFVQINALEYNCMSFLWYSTHFKVIKFSKNFDFSNKIFFLIGSPLWKQWLWDTKTCLPTAIYAGPETWNIGQTVPCGSLIEFTKGFSRVLRFSGDEPILVPKNHPFLLKIAVFSHFSIIVPAAFCITVISIDLEQIKRVSLWKNRLRRKTSE